jgi:heme-degrading monooxygenase HmoA
VLIKKALIRFSKAALLAVSAVSIATLSIAPSAAQTDSAPAGPVTVVVEIALVANSTSAEALVALKEMRALMKRQPGYLSEELLQNLNANNAPRYVHVSRWAALPFWAALFRTPEFSQLSAHEQEHYRLSVSAFMPAQ